MSASEINPFAKNYIVGLLVETCLKSEEYIVVMSQC